MTVPVPTGFTYFGYEMQRLITNSGALLVSASIATAIDFGIVNLSCTHFSILQ